jgi:pyrophosphatase PpaX
MIKAIILDWSGVLSDDIQLVYEIASKVFEKLGVEFMGIEQFKDRFDLPYMDFYRSMGVKLGKEELDKMYRQLFARHRKKASPFKFVKGALEWLHERGLKLAVFSSHPQQFLEKDIADHGLSGFFTHAVGGVHDKRTFVIDLLEKMGASREETLLVGDMAHDIEAGNLAGLMTAAVLSGYHRRERLEEKEPNFIIKDIRDIKFIVEGCYA